MESSSEVLLAITTFPDQECASEIGEALVKMKLAACVNLVPGAESIYEWKGEICREKEILGLIKSVPEKVKELEEVLLEMHPYDQPELILLPVTGGNQGYLEWVRSISS